MVLAICASVFLCAGIVLLLIDAHRTRGAAASRESTEPHSASSPVSPRQGRRGHGTASSARGRRKARSAWAADRSLDYNRDDELLGAEWHRGAASRDYTPHDVVSGIVYGYETHIADVGDTTVVAMRRPQGSTVVVEFIRAEDGESVVFPDDVVRLMEISGFVLASNQGPAALRAVDHRMEISLAAMPQHVRALWADRDWVVAEMPCAEDPEMWEAVLAPLAELVDCTWVLPPSEVHEHRLHPMDPTRPLLPCVQPEDTGTDMLSASRAHARDTRSNSPTSKSEYRRDDASHFPTILRPPEPIVLPSRVRAQSHGTMGHHAVGNDDVEAIASGKAKATDFYGTRILLGGDVSTEDASFAVPPPSIFDVSEEHAAHHGDGRTHKEEHQSSHSTETTKNRGSDEPTAL